MSEEFLKGWNRIDLFLHPPDFYPRAGELEIRRVETITEKTPLLRFQPVFMDFQPVLQKQSVTGIIQE